MVQDHHADDKPDTNMLEWRWGDDSTCDLGCVLRWVWIELLVQAFEIRDESFVRLEWDLEE